MCVCVWISWGRVCVFGAGDDMGGGGGESVCLCMCVCVVD